MSSLGRWFYIAIALFFVGLGLRYGWARGWTGVTVGYGLTLVGLVLCVVVVRRARADGES